MKNYQKYNQAAKIVGSKAWSNNRYHNLKYNALNRRTTKLEFTLTLADARKLYEKDTCFYCEEVSEIRTIDRVDNEKGYTPENSVSSCRKCNLLKGKLLKSDTDRMMKILQKLS